ncbi:MAG: sigma-70 domain-containing protein [Polyangiaceae bacterium]
MEALLAAHEREISLDDLGEAIGDRAASTDEIDAMISALESRGRTVGTHAGKSGVAMLRNVLDAAREVARERGKKPTHAEIAERSGLTVDEVRQALALARVMQR